MKKVRNNQKEEKKKPNMKLKMCCTDCIADDDAFCIIEMRRKRQYGIRKNQRVDKNYFMNLTLEIKEKGANEVIKQVTTNQVYLLRAESAKG